MVLGRVFGTYLSGLDRERVARLKLPLAATGVASVALFFLVRWMNGYACAERS